MYRNVRVFNLQLLNHNRGEGMIIERLSGIINPFQVQA
jgi:hypothetical protein